MSIDMSAMMQISAAVLKAQSTRMRVIAENIANADSTSRTPGGDPYRRQAPVFEPTKVAGGGMGVRMSKVEGDKTEFRQEYEPGNPAADAKGYVKMPNVNPLVEQMDMREAQHAYEANLNIISAARRMISRTLDILKG